MPFTVKGKTADGTEHEVTFDALPAGLIAEDQFQTRFQTELQRRTEGIKNSTRTELLADEAFRNEALKAWKIDPKAKGGEKLTDEQLASLQQSWMTEHVEPLKGQLGEQAKEVETLRRSQLVAEIVSAATGKVKAYLLKALREGGEPAVVALVEGNFAYDPKTKSWAVRKGDSFEFSANATADRPYKGVAEWFTEFTSKKDNADWLEHARNGAPNLGGMDNGGGGGEVRITRAEARDHSKWKAAEEQAKKIGGTVKIVD
jgi:hypothetical protein